MLNPYYMVHDFLSHKILTAQNSSTISVMINCLHLPIKDIAYQITIYLITITLPIYIKIDNAVP